MIGIFSGILILLGSIFAAGFWVAQARQVNGLEPALVQEWKQTISEQQAALEETKRNAQAHIDALSQRLGQLQAHVLRIDALGQRLTKMAKLDKGEFNFDQPPPQGGPENASELQSADTQQVTQTIDDLSRQLQDREDQLSVLETMMLHSNLRAQVSPAGRPIKGGWLSSYFGYRNDPFTGKREHHNGVDFAGKLGSDIIAVAAGVVTWSGDRYGYGNMVEIDHGNGYVTRYAHNQKNLVKVGDKIAKGQLIAKMGSSGRSTGPHVHFEVLRNGRVVDPLKHMQASR
jgi:murein DD-endopeptidase MepM/ murein hydrolase activator NlpD